MKLREITALLPADFRRRTWQMAAAVALRVALDLAGLAAVVAVLLTVTGCAEGRTGIWLAAAGAAAVVAAKNGLAIVLERRQIRRMTLLYRRLSGQLFRSYYARGLLFVRGNGSAELTHRVNYVCYAFVTQVLHPLLRMAGEGALLAAIVAALLVYNPRTTLILAACLVPLTAGYIRLARQRLAQCGKAGDEAKRRQWELVQEAFRGYAEVEVYQGFPQVYSRFCEGLDAISRERERTEAWLRIPPALTETGLLAGLLVLIGSGGDLRTTLGVFGVAAFRMLPGVRTLLACWTQVHNNAYTVGILRQGLRRMPETETETETYTNTESYTETETKTETQAGAETNTDTKAQGGTKGGIQANTKAEAEAETNPEMDSETNADAKTKAGADAKTEADAEADVPPGPRIRLQHELRLDNVTFAYGENRPVLRNFSLTVAKGERIGIQGPSGAGKSTLFNLILGFIHPQEGSVTVDGTELTPQNHRAWQAGIGYVPQEVFIARAPLAENIALGCGTPDAGRVREVLAQVQLAEWADALPPGTLPGENGCRLSGGQKQRIGIARALYKGAEVLLLDEATSSLDPATEDEVLRVVQELSVRQPGLTLLVISHRESALRNCTKIIQIDHTKGRG